MAEQYLEGKERQTDRQTDKKEKQKGKKDRRKTDNFDTAGIYKRDYKLDPK